jgi:hypothetical protein
MAFRTRLPRLPDETSLRKYLVQKCAAPASGRQRQTYSATSSVRTAGVGSLDDFSCRCACQSQCAAKEPSPRPGVGAPGTRGSPVLGGPPAQNSTFVSRQSSDGKASQKDVVPAPIPPPSADGVPIKSTCWRKLWVVALGRPCCTEHTEQSLAARPRGRVTNAWLTLKSTPLNKITSTHPRHPRFAGGWGVRLRRGWLPQQGAQRENPPRDSLPRTRKARVWWQNPGGIDLTLTLVATDSAAHSPTFADAYRARVGHESEFCQDARAKHLKLLARPRGIEPLFSP